LTPVTADSKVSSAQSMRINVIKMEYAGEYVVDNIVSGIKVHSKILIKLTDL